MKTIINGIHIFFEDFGDGIPMILIHGFPLDHSIWEDVVFRIEGHVRLIVPDLRGHGQSDAPDEVYEMDRMAADIAHLMDHLEIDRAILVGHSMGGYISLAFRKAYPDRVLGLGFAASQAAADSPERKAGRYQTIQEIQQNGVAAIADSMANRLTTKPDLVPVLRNIILAAKPAGVCGALRGLADRPDYSDSLAQIQTPAVVIAGEKDMLVPLEKSKDMAAQFSRGRMVVVPGGGHMPMLEAPGLVADALTELASKVKKPT